MPVNPYFSNAPKKVSNEHLLYEDLINEAIRINGHNTYYIVRDSQDEIDWVLGEDPSSKFTNVYEIEMYISSPDSWTGQSDLMSKFGLQVPKATTLTVATRAFNRYVPEGIRTRPQEGDLIFVSYMNKMFEIKYVDKEKNFYTLGKKAPYYYELSVEEFIFSHEKFDTEYEEINAVEDESSYILVLPLGSGSGSYWKNEVVSSGGFSAIVKDWFPSNSTLHLHTTIGTVPAGNTLTGGLSNTAYTVLDFDPKIQGTNIILSDASEMTDRTNAIVDRTETNPFWDFN